MENQIVIILRVEKKKIYLCQTHHKIKLLHKYELLESQEETIKYKHIQSQF